MSNCLSTILKWKPKTQIFTEAQGTQGQKAMTKSSTSRKALWFFPIRGLLLEGDRKPNEQSMFQKGDLWSKEETVTYLETVKYKSPHFIGQLQESQWDSCIVVNHRSGIFLEDEKDLVFQSPPPSQAAREIASKYLAALHFCVMTHASPQSRCVFSDTLPAYARWDISHDAALDQLPEQKASMDMGEPVKRTRAQLKQQFADSKQVALLSTHLDPNNSPITAGDVRKALASSTHYLINSCHQWSETERLLTAVTSIEMLMSNDVGDSNYLKLQNRIEALLGSEISKDVDIPETFQSRHKYVHHGETCASSKKALRLAATCQVNFANLAMQLQSKQLPAGLSLRDACLQYLDLLYQQQKLSWMQFQTSEAFEAVRLSDLV
jgi:hypothetical protein